ncbi:unnamed protein product [Macrosiphum euphorbiae]|uniref:Uncharacterized protein n=1 Tax=Macrosiphum euphorbiae TaxID=13131 RepID=A0AAV0XG81_9HEMI|nr:unnamed protein product [Macrosiphum euphorbiae]
MDSTDKHVEEPTDIHKAPNTPIVKKTKRKQNTEEESPMLKKAFQILNETSSATDSYFTYGQHIETNSVNMINEL